MTDKRKIMEHNGCNGWPGSAGAGFAHTKKSSSFITTHKTKDEELVWFWLTTVRKGALAKQQSTVRTTFTWLFVLFAFLRRGGLTSREGERNCLQRQTERELALCSGNQQSLTVRYSLSFHFWYFCVRGPRICRIECIGSFAIVIFAD